ncbi:hypothetical protein IMZ31_23820 (plasmid) [Pontibacillus sp. ALD_SL1]|uniref:hypothetical protein n=1 Tax=Pontibacillus sp. ALD_SL1 TaxID=2777185 RepID=UPI001A95AA6D|nr:hypothetical protein [Pontibacillus sp. ALD_SL1]QST02481.1 hypothetical protein IMZ31_23820 [Pontibacillus sp. ALD_SL1]
MSDRQKGEKHGKELTSETRIEGVGTVREYGKLDVQKLVKRLLESTTITKGK